MSVKVRRIKETECDLYNSADEIVGIIKSYLSMNDVRIQIKEQKLEGYYLVWKRLTYPIDKEGNIREWPRGLFDEIDNQLDKLIDW